MKAIRYITNAACLFMATACTDDIPATTAGQVPEGRAEIHFSLPGMLTVSPLEDGESRVAARTAAAVAETGKKDTLLLAGKEVKPLGAGTTLWLLAEGETDAGEAYGVLKSYVVRGAGSYQSLYPCKVDGEGNLVNEEAAPLYLPFGTYRFRVLSPARAFLDENGKPIEDLSRLPGKFRQHVANGDYLISNDERYEQTCLKEQTIEKEGSKVQMVVLNPLINQTARLKFTISVNPDDPYLHSCDISPAGVEISGLQNAYGGKGGDLWNWSPALEDTLVAWPGRKEERLVLFDDNEGVSKEETGDLVIKTAVLPTDCTSNSLIVLFNLSVNGIPTQYEMMLNRKVLRAGFSYHYKGVLSIEEGVTNITWQNVSWSTDVELDI